MYVVTALLFAEGRWGNSEGVLDYGAQARGYLDVMLNKEELSGGVVQGVTNLFDRDVLLPKHIPVEDSDNQVGVGSVLPAFFEVWGMVTDEPFWFEAAQRGREFLQESAHPETGLSPARTDYSGIPLPDEDIFNESTYGVGLANALDFLWWGVDVGQVDLADRRTSYFANYPSNPYPSIYKIDGQPLNDTPSGALVAHNGATAAIATISEREGLVRRVWETPMPQGLYRFFDGINQMQALLVLGGYYRPF
jgi:oligosaccharide reducing-end xylanase